MSIKKNKEEQLRRRKKTDLMFPGGNCSFEQGTEGIKEFGRNE